MLLLLLPQMYFHTVRFAAEGFRQDFVTCLLGSVTAMGVGFAIVSMYLANFIQGWTAVLGASITVLMVIGLFVTALDAQRKSKLVYRVMPDNPSENIRALVRQLSYETERHYTNHPADKPASAPIEDWLKTYGC